MPRPSPNEARPALQRTKSLDNRAGPGSPDPRSAAVSAQHSTQNTPTEHPVAGSAHSQQFPAVSKPKLPHHVPDLARRTNPSHSTARTNSANPQVKTHGTRQEDHTSNTSIMAGTFSIADLQDMIAEPSSSRRALSTSLTSASVDLSIPSATANIETAGIPALPMSKHSPLASTTVAQKGVIKSTQSTTGSDPPALSPSTGRPTSQRAPAIPRSTASPSTSSMPLNVSASSTIPPSSIAPAPTIRQALPPAPASGHKPIISNAPSTPQGHTSSQLSRTSAQHTPKVAVLPTGAQQTSQLSGAGAGPSTTMRADERRVSSGPQRVQYSSAATTSSLFNPQSPPATSMLTAAPAPAPSSISIPSGSSDTSSANQGASLTQTSDLSSIQSSALLDTALPPPQDVQLPYIDAIDDIEVLREVATVHQSTVRRLQAAQASTMMQLASAQRDYAYVQNRIQVLNQQRHGNNANSQSPVVGPSLLQLSTDPTTMNHPTGSTFDVSQLLMDYDDPTDGQERKL